MQGPSKETVQPKRKFGDKPKDKFKGIKQNLSQAPSPQPSRPATPGLSAQEESSKEGGDAGIPTPEWKAWNIDGDAITQLRKWDDDHKDSKWRRLAEKIDQALKSKTLDTLKAFIPDTPIPAKTLVEALLNLVELGIVRHFVTLIPSR